MRKSFIVFCLMGATALFSSFSIAPPEEYGKAGYYADTLHGRKTASGEKYDKNDLTCAHKTLPFGTKIRVTRIDNQKSVVVRVNDRGPFIDGYVVDISRRAAEEIGLIRDGITRVRVDVVEEASQSRVAAQTDGNTKLLAAREEAKQLAKGTTLPVAKGAKPAAYDTDPSPATAKPSKGSKVTAELFQVGITQPEKSGFAVQISTLFDADNVLPTLRKLQTEFPGKALVFSIKDESSNNAVYKILVGPYGDKKTAEVQQKAAVKKGYKKCFVVDLESL
ncbi:MAG: septal ring lytic transglycosylase RlpA family protein [Saprospiraceae bacterium]|nr:septal ring lytic transglycosylase RlpA family protein [Saprospiraceae bacterium]